MMKILYPMIQVFACAGSLEDFDALHCMLKYDFRWVLHKYEF